MHDILQKHNIQTAVLSQIEFSQVFSIRELSLSLENLGALLAASTREQSLIIIEDLSSIAAEINWMSSESNSNIITFYTFTHLFIQLNI